MTTARALLLLALVSVPACSRVGGPEPAAPPPPTPQPEAVVLQRAYQGTVEFQGSTLPVRLEIAGPADDLQASLVIPALSLTAQGTGSLQGSRLRLQLNYGTDCAGQVEVEGLGTDAGATLEGRLVATDCTGSEEGILLLRMRGSAGAAPASAPRGAPADRVQADRHPAAAPGSGVTKAPV